MALSFHPPPLVALLLLAGCGEEGAETSREAPAPAPAAQIADDPDPPTARRAQAEELLADLRAPRHSSDGAGRAWLEPVEGDETTPVRAGERRSFRLVFEAGPEGIAVGGSVHFMPEPFWGWSTPQDVAQGRPGFTRVTTDAEGVELETAVVGGVQAGYLVVTVAGRALAAGEQVTFLYGAGPAGAQVDRQAERGARLWFHVDGDGDGVRGLLEDSPTVDILPGPPERLVLTGPSVVRPGETATYTVAVLDALANAGLAVQGEVLLQNRPPGWDVPAAVELDDGGVASVSFVAREPGVLRLRGRLELGELVLETEAPPTWVNPDTPRVLWGDLHGHSGLSDGTGTPEDFYRYARDVAGLDVAALTDHDHFGVQFLDTHPELWEGIRAVTEEHHEPGRFVTLLAYEWTSWIHGHRHVLYFDSAEQTCSILSSLDERYDTPRELWAALEGRAALTFAHHTAGDPVPTNWSFAPDPVLEPLTEIASVHGSSEAADCPRTVRGALRGHFVRDALDRGYRLGFVGSGDGHDGHPGLAHLSPVYGWLPPRSGEEHARLGTGGLAGILAAERTRASVLEALRARATYATSGPRILVEARLAGSLFGSALPADELGEECELELVVLATAPLRSIDLVRPGRPVERLELSGERRFAGRLPVAPGAAGDYLYLRIEQADGGMAWTSPWFFE